MILTNDSLLEIADDARSDNNMDLRAAAEYGQIKALKYIVEIFNLTRKDAVKKRNFECYQYIKDIVRGIPYK